MPAPLSVLFNMEATSSINDLEDSFSFSFRDNDDSVVGFFSEDEDEGSFIEIKLDTGRGPEEFDLRISFSSLPYSDLSVQFPENTIQVEGDGTQITPVHSFKFPTLEGSVGKEVSGGQESPQTAKGKGKVSPEEDRRLDKRRKSQQLFSSRKAYKITTTFNGGMMKLFLKFRSGKILSTLISLIKSYDIIPDQVFKARQQRRQGRIWKCPRLSNPFQKWLALINTTYLADDDEDHSVNGGLDAQRSTSCSRSVMDVQSSRSSFRLLLIRRDLFSGKSPADDRDGSVCAAIAHCKRSLGDFGGFSR